MCRMIPFIHFLRGHLLVHFFFAPITQSETELGQQGVGTALGQQGVGTALGQQGEETAG